MSSPEPVTTAEKTDRYRDGFIAMTFFAIVFFLILVVIVVLWCKKRRQTEVKTVVIQPKRRPQTAKSSAHTNGGGQHANGGVDAEAGGSINLEGIELSDGSDETKPEQATPDTTEESVPATLNTESEVNPEPNNQKPAKVDEVKVDTELANDQSSDTAALSPASDDWQVVDKGETNPTFEKGDDE